MDIEIKRQIAEYDRKHLKEIDAMILWQLHEQFGFGPKRLKQFYDALAKPIDELVKRCEMDDQIWLCTYMLRKYGVDIEQWEKERGGVIGG